MTRLKCVPNSLNNGSIIHSAGTDTKSPPLHRLGEIRRREGISRRTIARRLDIDIAAVKLEECESSDIPLSILYQWQKALGVPVAELLMEPEDALSTPLDTRAQLVRLMKTARSILDQTTETRVKRLAQTLMGQLTDIMPELRDVLPWPVVGTRRRRQEYGRAAEQSLPDDIFANRGE